MYSLWMWASQQSRALLGEKSPDFCRWKVPPSRWGHDLLLCEAIYNLNANRYCEQVQQVQAQSLQERQVAQRENETYEPRPWQPTHACKGIFGAQRSSIS